MDEVVPPLLVKLMSRDPKQAAGSATFIAEFGRAVAETATFSVAWDLGKLSRRLPDLRQRVGSFQQKRTVHAERVTELAALGLAMCAIGVYLDGARVERVNTFASPDLVLDPGEPYRGVEVAGRSSASAAGLRTVAREKARVLLANAGVREGYLSLWSFRPKRFTIWERVR